MFKKKKLFSQLGNTTTYVPTVTYVDVTHLYYYVPLLYITLLPLFIALLLVNSKSISVTHQLLLLWSLGSRSIYPNIYLSILLSAINHSDDHRTS